MCPPKLFILMAVVMLVSGCVTQEQKNQAFETKLRTVYGPECLKSLGLIAGEPGTDEERINLMWCISKRVAKDKLDNGSNDLRLKAIAIWIPNCEAILGTDWGEFGSEKRAKLVRCIDMQEKQEIELQNKTEQLRMLQQLINSRTKEQIINCYSYGNWTQCK